ncbi:MAG TPA: DUF3180 domain-containing protein [Mycobacteriales bacterium]|jgi:hypothetical protein|nr:DUF3180 domain-containing protein [Mycobacteriales bacterium]
MRPTRARSLIACSALVAVISAALLQAFYGSLPPLPVGPVLTILLVAAFEALLAWSTRNRLQGKQSSRPAEPLAIARYAALARASSLVGAGVAGAWIGVLLFLAHQRGSLAAVSHDRQLAPFGIVTGLALVGAALWLESVCRVRPPD